MKLTRFGPLRPKQLALLALVLLVWWYSWRCAVEPYDDPQDDADETWLEGKLAELHAHLSKADPELEEEVSVVKDVRILEDADARKLPNGRIGFKSGKFQHSTGVLFVGGRDGKGRRRSRAGMLMTLLHEMAHATMGPTETSRGKIPHNKAWRKVWMTLLKHATQHLGWEVEVRCAECTYYDLCETKQCPKCQWMQETCAPYQGGSPSDLKRVGQS